MNIKERQELRRDGIVAIYEKHFKEKRSQFDIELDFLDKNNGDINFEKYMSLKYFANRDYINFEQRLSNRGVTVTYSITAEGMDFVEKLLLEQDKKRNKVVDKPQGM